MRSTSTGLREHWLDSVVVNEVCSLPCSMCWGGSVYGGYLQHVENSQSKISVSCPNPDKPYLEVNFLFNPSGFRIPSTVQYFTFSMKRRNFISLHTRNLIQGIDNITFTQLLPRYFLKNYYLFIPIILSSNTLPDIACLLRRVLSSKKILLFQECRFCNQVAILCLCVKRKCGSF